MIGWLAACCLNGKRRTQLGETPMCYVGLDISLSTASLCVVDKDASVFVRALWRPRSPALPSSWDVFPAPPVRVGLEAGPLSGWITAALI